MEESPIGKYFPFWIDWYKRASASWEDSWVAPILLLLCDMWPKGCALDNKDELLARTARVPLKTWMRIREETSFFWVVRDGKFVQPFLEEKYLEALDAALKRSEKASKGGKAKQAHALARQAKDLAGQAASSSAPSTAPSSSSSTPQALLKPPIRASIGLNLSEEEGREDLRANTVPKPAYIEASFQAYPRERRGKNAANRTVPIPADARERIALFLLENPAYPLLEVFQAIAKTCDFPPPMADFLAEPWDAESTMRAAQGRDKGAGGKAVEVEKLEQRYAQREDEWNSLTEAEQERRLQESEKRMGIKIGRG